MLQWASRFKVGNGLRVVGCGQSCEGSCSEKMEGETHQPTMCTSPYFLGFVCSKQGLDRGGPLRCGRPSKGRLAGSRHGGSAPAGLEKRIALVSDCGVHCLNLHFSAFVLVVFLPN